MDEFYVIRKNKEKQIFIIIDFETGNILYVMLSKTKYN